MDKILCPYVYDESEHRTETVIRTVRTADSTVPDSTVRTVDSAVRTADTVPIVRTVDNTLSASMNKKALALNKPNGGRKVTYTTTVYHYNTTTI
jgi:hypothetical protein